jgi:hypothetical protein
MNELYQSTPGEVNMWNNTLLANRGLQGQQTSGSIDQRMQNNPNTNWASTIGQIAGGAAGAMTGLGALGVGAKAAGTAGKVASASAPFMATGQNLLSRRVPGTSY